jgi:redox-sensitive bicupin YhaK (pirin superfamily)
MIEIRDFNSFGSAEIGWLTARHHFSFADYLDRDRMNWGVLRVWNDDTIQPGKGFERHGHKDMEIITYVREGAISHKDHLGNQGRTEAGNVQVMSAGKGILHEEFNLEDGITRIFQIWIEPAEFGGDPYWEAREFPAADRANQLIELASGRRDTKSGALPIRQDAALFGALIEPGAKVSHQLEPGRMAYAVVSSGTALINGSEIAARSSAAIAQEAEITIEVAPDAAQPAELLLADLPPA